MTKNQQLKQDELFAHIDEALALPRITPEQITEAERIAMLNRELWGRGTHQHDEVIASRSELDIAFDREWVAWDANDILFVTDAGVKAGFGLRP